MMAYKVGRILMLTARHTREDVISISLSSRRGQDFANLFPNISNSRKCIWFVFPKCTNAHFVCYEPFWLDFKGLFASFLKEIQWTVMAKANAKARKKNWEKKISLSFQFFLVKRKNYNLFLFFSRSFFFGTRNTPAYVLLKQMATKGTTLYS